MWVSILPGLRTRWRSEGAATTSLPHPQPQIDQTLFTSCVVGRTVGFCILIAGYLHGRPHNNITQGHCLFQANRSSQGYMCSGHTLNRHSRDIHSTSRVCAILVIISASYCHESASQRHPHHCCPRLFPVSACRGWSLRDVIISDLTAIRNSRSK